VQRETPLLMTWPVALPYLVEGPCLVLSHGSGLSQLVVLWVLVQRWCHS